MFSRRLVWQIYRAFLFLLIVPALLFTWYTTHTFKKFFVNHTRISLTEKSQQFASHVSNYTLSTDADAIDSLCKYLARKIDTRFTVIDLDGKVFGDSEKNPDSMENHANRMEIVAARGGDIGIADRFSYTLNQKMLYVAVPVVKNGAVKGVVRSSISIENIQEELNRIYSRIAFGYLVVALIAAGLSYIVSRQISLPIFLMKQGAERFASGDFTGKLTQSGCVELDQLTSALNEMASHLRDNIKRLQEQHNRIEAVLSSMAEGVIALDNEQRIITINSAAVQHFALDIRPDNGTWIGEVLRNAKVNQFISRIREHGVELQGETSLLLPLKNGSTAERLLQVHGNALKDAGGETIGALIVINDVTRIRKLETMRSDFVANVSHELRTPLTSVKGFVETLLAGAIDDKDEARHFLQIIARQVDRLSTIVADLLALSRVEQDNKNHSIEMQRISLKELVGRALESCGNKASEKEITLKVDVPQGLFAKLEPALMEEALINLVDNAINYSPGGSVVGIAAGIDSRSGEIKIDISDNGPGIPEEHHERIFERFYRVDKARSRKLGGTGLGLSIVKHIALVHNGRVGLRSVVGEGSTFTIYLPKSEESPKEQQNDQQ